MRGNWTVRVMCVLWAASLSAPARADSEHADARCAVLFDRAAEQLGAGQYARMLSFAEDRLRLCPDPKSAFLVGLAQANMVDAQVVSDPAEREQMRRRALRNLRVAAQGGSALRPEWHLTIGEWVVTLQREGDAAQPLDAPRLYDQEEIFAELEEGQEPPLRVPKAPPPQPQPAFPWGPSICGVVGVGALVAGLILRANANSKIEEANEAAKGLVLLDGQVPDEQWAQLAREVTTLAEEGEAEKTWATVSLVGGAGAVVTGVLWYALFPPEGKWRWAVAPTGVQLTGRF